MNLAVVGAVEVLVQVWRNFWVIIFAARANLNHLAYAAFHCSSLRALATSISSCVTNRDPTTPEDNDGTRDSSMDGSEKQKRVT